MEISFSGGAYEQREVQTQPSSAFESLIDGNVFEVIADTLTDITLQ